MQWSDDFIDAVAEAFSDGCNTTLGSGGTLEFFDGTLPANTTDPDDGTMLVSCTAGDPNWNFANAPTRMLLAGALGGSSTGAGLMTYFRLKNSGGDVLMQGTCGVLTEDFVWTPTATFGGAGEFVFVSGFNFLLTVTPS